MAAPGGYSYRPNVNRAVTKKWKDASQANYDGDDWGDEGYDPDEPVPVSAGNPRHPAWGPQGQVYPANRSVTNPSPSRSGGRASFDRGDERRNFSSGAGAGGFESPYPTTQRAPFPEPQHDFQPQPQMFRAPPPLQPLYTQGQGPYPPGVFRPGSRGQQYPSYPDVPYSAPGPYPQQRPNFGNRPVQDEIPPQHDRSESMASSNSGKYFPPRKSSLSHQQPPADIANIVREAQQAAEAPQSAPTEVKAVPFIRPADIYKRMEEEREKERRSQESSRPSIDSATERVRDTPASARSAVSETNDDIVPRTEHVEELDSARRLKPTLDTVVERKSEYGFDNLLQNADPAHYSPQEVTDQSGGVHRQITNASSIYTNRPDPVSASSESPADEPDLEPTAAQPDHYNLPQIDRMSTFGTDLSGITPTQTREHQPVSSVQGPVQLPMTASESDHVSPSVASPDRLAHQPSFGFNSIVQQAFDESQNQNSLSPTSITETLPRSNSASTSEISPIISRHPEGDLSRPDRSIPEELTSEDVSTGDPRPVSSSTLKPEQVSKEAQALPAPPHIQQGYRRDTTPPSRDNSPAKKPLSIQTNNEAKSEKVVFASTLSGPSTSDKPGAGDESQLRGRPAESLPTSAAPVASSTISPTSQTHMASPAIPRSTSEEYQEWQSQRKQFNAKFGIQDSNPTTPGIPSPVSRSGTPGKINARESEEKVGNHLGQQALVGRSGLEHGLAVNRPAVQTREESFRPQLPGGWQSYSATPAPGTPSQETLQALQPPKLPSQARSESTDSIPTAKAPRDQYAQHTGPSDDAFAAAAAAGTALAGSFSGPALTGKSAEDSEDSSEDEWDRSSTSSKHAAIVSETRDFAAPPSQSSSQPAVENRSSIPPPPLPKDTPIESKESKSSDYFPAPLRTSKVFDTKPTARAPIPEVSFSSKSAADHDNERLQQEIVQSLTPKSSHVDWQPVPTEHSELPRSSAEANIGRSALSAVEQTASTHGPTAGIVAAPSTIPKSPESGARETTRTQEAATSLTAAGAPAQRPFLEQRFSWETGNELSSVAPVTPPKIKTPSVGSPSTVRAAISETPEDAAAKPSTVNTPKSPSWDRPPTSGSGQPSSHSGKSKSTLPIALPVPQVMHGEKITFRGIMNMENQRDRIQAFNDNNTSYAVSDGLLEQWLVSMKTPEHSDVFASNGSSVQGKPRTSVSDMNRPSPGRATASGSGSKQIQEDGKRLMAAAGRFSGKAGFAAKGLFAKGKDKLRTASAGDKGFIANRRKSAGPSILEPEQPWPQKRGSTFLEAPPQIPPQVLNSSPVDVGSWALPFDSTPDRGVTAEKAVLPPEPVKSTVTSTSDHQSERTIPGPSSAAIPSIRPMSSTSPPVSAVASMAEDGTAIPSRSISQVTGHDTEPSGEETPREGVVASDLSRVSEARSVADAASVPATAIQASTTEPGIDAASTLLDNVTNERVAPGAGAILSVPQDRRPSDVSNVSSPSPLPAAEQEQGDRQIRHSISPAEEDAPRDESVPSYQAAASSKEQEAIADRKGVVAPGLDDPVPSYHEHFAPVDASRKPRIAADAQIVPVAALSQQNRTETPIQPSRPFSFMGIENLNGAHQIPGSQEEILRGPSQPLSPVSQPLSQSMSQVSAEDPRNDPTSPADRQRRSYSRPFGADGTLPEHSAQQHAHEPIDRSRMYSTDSPLPSARRPPEELHRYRQQSPPVPESKEEGYRIPGPYGQEYRSPRLNSVQGQTPAMQSRDQPFAQHTPSGHLASTTQPYPIPPQFQPNQQVPLTVPVYPEVPKSKQRSFGGLFGNKSKSRNQQNETDRVGEELDLAKQKRSSIFRRNSRRESVSSQQSSMHESRDQIGQLPPADRPGSSKRRLSRDLFRSGTPPSVDRPGGMKGRLSGMGSLFNKGMKVDNANQPQRSSTLPTNSGPSPRPAFQGEPSTFVPTHYSTGAPTSQAPRGPFHGNPPPTSGYYAPPQSANSYQPHHYPQGPVTMAHEYKPVHDQHDRFTQQTPQSFERRPADLRIDTGSGVDRNLPSLPATAPPHTHANRDISYSARPYVPPGSRGSPSGPVTAHTEGPAAHVINLHKRSRSPRLGRRSSSEERRPADVKQSLAAPTGTLGTFSSKRISPDGGVPRPAEDQEAPFRIGIPGEPGEEERKKRARQAVLERAGANDRPVSPISSGPMAGKTVAERFIGPQVADSQSPSSAVRAPLQQGGGTNLNTSAGASASTSNDKKYVAELPGSKAEGYESEEEIPMSATAYPGQWQDMPLFVGDGRWDD